MAEAQKCFCAFEYFPILWKLGAGCKTLAQLITGQRYVTHAAWRLEERA